MVIEIPKQDDGSNIVVDLMQGVLVDVPCEEDCILGGLHGTDLDLELDRIDKWQVWWRPHRWRRGRSRRLTQIISILEYWG